MNDVYTPTLHTYLAIKTMEQTGCGWTVAVEAVASTAMTHDWDLDERRTWAEWEKALGSRGLTT